MRTNNLFSRLAMVLAITLALSSLHEVYAAGTRAGTKLTSTATINYKDKNGFAMDEVNGSVSIYVAHKPASTLSITTANQEGYDGGYVVYAMTVTNNGNGQDRFQFLTDSTSYTLVDSVGFYKNSGLTDHLIGSTKDVMNDTVTNDGTYNVWAKVYLKKDVTVDSLSLLNAANTIQFYTRSTAQTNASYDGDSSYKTQDGLYDRVVSTSHLHALSSTVSRTTKVKQSHLVITSTNAAGYTGAPGVGTGHRPGATIGYQVSVTNNGHGRSENTVVRFNYPSDMSFASGTGWTDNGTYATYNFGNVAPGATVTTPGTDSLKLLLADNSSVLEASTRTPSFTATYNDSTNGLTGRTRVKNTTPSTFTVKYKYYAVSIAYNDTTETGESADSITFKFTITNNSNGYDYVDTRFIGATQLPDSFNAATKWYFDKNGDGNLTVGVDSIFTSNSDGYRSTSIGAGQTLVIFARTIVPSGLTNSDKNIVYRGSSARDSSTSGDYYLGGTLTPKLPLIVVTRTRVLHDSVAAGVAGAASIAPGGSVTFYVDITNSGTGKATNVIIVDDIGTRSELAGFGGADTVWVWDGSGAEGKVVNPTGSYTADDQGYSEIKKDGTGYVIKTDQLLVSERRRIRYRLTLQ